MKLATFQEKKKAYLKAKIEELETNSKIKNIRDLYRGINDFKKCYQPRTNIVKDEKGDLVADTHSILARWRNYFSQLLNVHGVNDVRETEIHTAEPYVYIMLDGMYVTKSISTGLYHNLDLWTANKLQLQLLVPLRLS